MIFGGLITISNYAPTSGAPSPPETFFMITETGNFMLTEDGLNLMITE